MNVGIYFPSNIRSHYCSPNWKKKKNHCFDASTVWPEIPRTSMRQRPDVLIWFALLLFSRILGFRLHLSASSPLPLSLSHSLLRLAPIDQWHSSSLLHLPSRFNLSGYNDPNILIDVGPRLVSGKCGEVEVRACYRPTGHPGLHASLIFWPHAAFLHRSLQKQCVIERGFSRVFGTAGMSDEAAQGGRSLGQPPDPGKGPSRPDPGADSAGVQQPAPGRNAGRRQVADHASAAAPGGAAPGDVEGPPAKKKKIREKLSKRRVDQYTYTNGVDLIILRCKYFMHIFRFLFCVQRSVRPSRPFQQQQIARKRGFPSYWSTTTASCMLSRNHERVPIYI